nr:SprB repeat-containing protein [Bacteroidales bacterium]
VKSSDNRVVYPALMGNKLGFIQYGTGTAEITVTATVEPLSRSRSFTLSINAENQPQDCELTLSAKITNPKCRGGEDGKIELTVSGGTEPYYYKWSTGRTSDGLYNVGAGSYSVLVMDESGCTAEQSFEVSEPVALEISETLTPSTCGGSNGKIEVSVSGGNAPYSYSWKNITETASSLENISAGSYEVTVTDGNSCKQTKTISLADQGAATIAQKTINPSKCNEATGSVEVSVSGGTAPLNYEWSDSASVANNLYRPKLYAGEYNLRVVDSKNCTSILSVQVPLIPLRQPKLALVSYDDTLKHNIVVWQKENTDDIDQYYIYREIDSLGNYDKIDSLNYSEISVYVDETAQHKKQAYRYEISAMNSCMESPVSKEFKTINLQRKVEDDGAVQLWWNAYEGCEYVSYSLYRVTENGSEFMLNLPANKFKYTDEQPKEGTIGYYILIHLSEKIDVSQLLKAQNEPSAYDYIISTIAYIRNDIEKESIGILSCNAVVYSKDKSIIISNAVGNNVFVFDVEGKLVAQRQNVDSAEIPVQTAGVYVVIVGKNVFKVFVE